MERIEEDIMNRSLDDCANINLPNNSKFLKTKIILFLFGIFVTRKMSCYFITYNFNLILFFIGEGSEEARLDRLNTEGLGSIFITNLNNSEEISVSQNS